MHGAAGGGHSSGAGSWTGKSGRGRDVPQASGCNARNPAQVLLVAWRWYMSMGPMSPGEVGSSTWTLSCVAFRATIACPDPTNLSNSGQDEKGGFAGVRSVQAA